MTDDLYEAVNDFAPTEESLRAELHAEDESDLFFDMVAEKDTEIERLRASERSAWNAAVERDVKIERLRAEVERERMRLAACGVIAMADTPESARQSRTMHADYESASCDAVARRVDECIAMRAEIERLNQQIESRDFLLEERRLKIEQILSDNERLREEKDKARM